IPLEFEPYGGMFVVFMKKVGQAEEVHGSTVGKNFPELKPVQEITGAWTVQFDPKWFYPDKDEGRRMKAEVTFEKLEDWRTRSEEAVKNFSGTAVYRKVFKFTGEDRSQKTEDRIYLDLGIVKETARVKLNGKDLGVLWCSPWRVDITGAVKTGENTLEISVVNLWPNRLVGDNNLSGEQRRTRTEMFMGGPDYSFSSGLLGPVTIQSAQPTATKASSK
ncbi:MAG: glycosylhydrolase-like jelly roll fold domain-containing protein, partial [bacterium]